MPSSSTPNSPNVAPNYHSIAASLKKSPKSLNALYDLFDYEPQSPTDLHQHLKQVQHIVHECYRRYGVWQDVMEQSTEAIRVQKWTQDRYWEFYDLLTEKLVLVFETLENHSSQNTPFTFEKVKYNFLELWTQEWKFLFSDIFNHKSMDYSKMKHLCNQKVWKREIYENDALMEWIVMVLIEQYTDTWLLWVTSLQKYLKVDNSNLNQLKRILNLIVGLKVPLVSTNNAKSSQKKLLQVAANVDSSRNYLSTNPRPEFTQAKYYREAFIQMWMTILRRPDLDHSVYKHILNRLASDVIPYFQDRAHLLNPFIQEAFNRGGEPALLSVQSLFSLMTKHGLVVDDFYTKLYSLIHPSIFDEADQVGQFLDFLEVALGSPKITETILIAFCKKIARVALSSPAYATIYWIRLISTLLFKHPFLHKLVHGEDALFESIKLLGRYQLQQMDAKGKLDKILGEQDEDAMIDEDETLTDDQRIMIRFSKLLKMKANIDTSDEFNECAMEPEESHAADSSLWELETLREHPFRSIQKESKKIRKVVKSEAKRTQLAPSTRDLKIDLSYDELFLQMIGSTHHHCDVKADVMYDRMSCFRE